MASCFRYGLVVLAAVLYSLQVTAAPVVRPASTTDIFKKGGQTLDINRHWGEIIDVKPTPSTSAKVNVPVKLAESFNWARVGTWVKNGLKSHPGKIAATAGLLWAIDQIPGASIDGTSPVRLPSTRATGAYWETSRDKVTLIARFADSSAACKSLVGSYPYFYYGAQSGVWYPCYGSNRADGGGVLQGHVQRVPYDCPYGVDAQFRCLTTPPGSTPQPFTDADYDELASKVPLIPEPLWNSGFGSGLADIPGTFDGPDGIDFGGPSSIDLPASRTTTTDSVSGNTTVVESLPSVRFDYGTNPLSITPTTSTTTNTYTNGQLQSSTTTNTQTNTNNSTVVTTPAPDIPTDCAFMPTVCAFIEWVKQPFTEEAPDFADLIDDQDFSESITIPGNATCPAPTMIETNLGSFEFSWQPACTWAGMIKPLVIIAALIAAIYISLGVARSE